MDFLDDLTVGGHVPDRVSGFFVHEIRGIVIFAEMLGEASLFSPCLLRHKRRLVSIGLPLPTRGLDDCGTFRRTPC